MSVRFVVLVVVITAVGALPAAAQIPSINQRPTTAKAVITGSPKLRDGSFTASGTSGICGVMPKEVVGEDTFVIEFPNDTPTGTITSISFGSKELVGKNTKSTVFRLNVGVTTAKGGRPPNYVLNSGEPKMKGEATVVNDKGVTILHVVGTEVMGETIDLTVECRPGGK
jgi:hypothetical protein